MSPIKNYQLEVKYNCFLWTPQFQFHFSSQPSQYFVLIRLEVSIGIIFWPRIKGRLKTSWTNLEKIFDQHLRNFAEKYFILWFDVKTQNSVHFGVLRNWSTLLTIYWLNMRIFAFRGGFKDPFFECFSAIFLQECVKSMRCVYSKHPPGKYECFKNTHRILWHNHEEISRKNTRKKGPRTPLPKNKNPHTVVKILWVYRTFYLLWYSRSLDILK